MSLINVHIMLSFFSFCEQTTTAHPEATCLGVGQAQQKYNKNKTKQKKAAAR